MFADNIDESTDANELIAPVHDRMPVILFNEQGVVWMDSDGIDVSGLLSLLKPYPAEEMNSVANAFPAV
jgi:putative SOS response-associated peptidase YedK